jgi:hypothetical protein
MGTRFRYDGGINERNEPPDLGKLTCMRLFFDAYHWSWWHYWIGWYLYQHISVIARSPHEAPQQSFEIRQLWVYTERSPRILP